MYNWNKKYIKALISYLKKCDKNTKIIQEEINLLYNLLNKNYKYKVSIENDIENFSEIFDYNDFIYYFVKKYFYCEKIDYIDYETIKTSKKEQITYAIENIKRINKNWYDTINKEYIFNNHNILSLKRNNDDFVYSLPYTNNFFISLAKKNTIEDYIVPTHEYLHIYTFIKNQYFYKNIEKEFFSILGELIYCYENKNSTKREEILKYELNRLYSNLNDIKKIGIRNDLINNNIDSLSLKKYLKNKFNLNKSDIPIIYDQDLEELYLNTISYFLALELLDIYKKDKEKCFYICDDIIMDKNSLEKKLSKHNICLLENDDKYIKKLKKEYEMYNN